MSACRGINCSAPSIGGGLDDRRAEGRQLFGREVLVEVLHEGRVLAHEGGVVPGHVEVHRAGGVVLLQVAVDLEAVAQEDGLHLGAGLLLEQLDLTRTWPRRASRRCWPCEWSGPSGPCPGRHSWPGRPVPSWRGSSAGAASGASVGSAGGLRALRWLQELQSGPQWGRCGLRGSLAAATSCQHERRTISTTSKVQNVRCCFICRCPP